MMATEGDDAESLSDRQENEILVLQSMYMDDVRDLRMNDPWKVRRPPEMQITLRPQESNNTRIAHVQVDLLVKCPALYPNVVPTLTLINPKGLGNQQLQILKDDLDSMAKKLTGEVMMLELCQYVQKYLHSHNKAPVKSFYDEMIANQRIQEEKIAKEHKQKEQLLRKKEAELIECEIEKREEALREEARKRRELLRQNSETRYSTCSDPSTPSTEAFSNMTPIPKDTQQRHRRSVSPCSRTPGVQHMISETGSHHKPERTRRTSTPLLSSETECLSCGDSSLRHGVTTLTFNTKKEHKIYVGRCLGHSCRGSTVYAGMDTKTGDLVAISEWVLKWRHTNRKLDLDEKEIDERETNKYMKQVLAIEKEMFSLLRLSHPNLLNYQGFKFVQESGKIVLYLLMGYVGGGNLGMYIKSKKTLQLDQLRFYATQTLQVLEYIHGKAVVHRDLRASSLMLNREGQLCLADVSLVKRLSDLVQEVRSYNCSDVTAPVIGGRSGKKADIYKLGLVLLSLVRCEVIVETLPVIPNSLPIEFHDFLTKCIEKEEVSRWTAQQLLEHSFVKTPIYCQPSKICNQQSTNVDKNQHLVSDEDTDDDHIIPFIPASDSGSRLQNEFEILKWLGKGGFGDVIKVRNKLDIRFYAIKRIPLNPTKKAFTKKITREVKLLSMLNHENVVRYYNSWIETSTDPAYSETSSARDSHSQSYAWTGKVPKPAPAVVTKPPMQKSLVADVGSAAFPDVVDASIEWSVSVNLRQDSSSSSESSEDEDDVFGATYLPHSDSEDDGIVFEQNSDEDEINAESSTSEKSLVVPEPESVQDETDGTVVPQIQFLYIQMEFCERNTLRHCIDAGIYQDVDRVWQLFREIVEGLVHIHKLGMIHRDLKPVNIFLDSNDNVKIGDFGLATTDIIAKQHTTLMDLTMNPVQTRDLNVSVSHSESVEGMEDLTGKVGTALYVAPEMTSTSKRVHYNQKVDIYSLGVMFFEMCYHPLPTGMERVKILTGIREPTINLPEDFDVSKLNNQTQLIRLLLSHDPSRRPTAAEILQSEFVPPPHMEEAELNEMLRSTIANPDSRLYKRMIESIFSQPITPAMDFAYDNELYKSSNEFNPNLAQVTSHVSDIMERIFRKHGAIRISTPMLMPKSKQYENNESYVCFMDRMGGLVALPHDLKTPFARFAARHGVTDLKRYTIEKVFRENRVYGLHPRELLACSFDIVTSSTSSLLLEAEVISVVFEIISEIPVLQSRGYFLRINHKVLLEGILVYCKVPYQLHKDVYAILGDTKNEKQRKTQIQTRLYSLSLSEHSVQTLYGFVETEGPINKVSSMLRKITKSNDMVSSPLVLKGLKEIEAIISYLDILGIKSQIVVTLGLITNIQNFSGAVFQVVRILQKKTKQTTEVLAAGGRYDKLLVEFRKPDSDMNQCAVGISLSMERVVAAVMEDKTKTVSASQDVVIYCAGMQQFAKDKLTVARDLWAAGISAAIIHDHTLSLDDIEELCQKSGASHIVILRDSESQGLIRVRSLDKDKFNEKKLKIGELTAYLQLKIQSSIIDSSEQCQSQSSKSGCGQSTVDNTTNKESLGTVGYKRNVNMTILLDQNTKSGKNNRRNYESQIYTILSSCFSKLCSKSSIEIIVVDLTSAVLKTIAAFLEVGDSEDVFSESIGPIIERHPRYRKYLTKIFDHISYIKFEKSIPIIILYGNKDESYKVLL